MNPEDSELSMVRHLLQEAIARAERAEAECEELRQRHWRVSREDLEEPSREAKEVLRDLEKACRELQRLHGVAETERGF